MRRVHSRRQPVATLATPAAEPAAATDHLAAPTALTAATAVAATTLALTAATALATSHTTSTAFAAFATFPASPAALAAMLSARGCRIHLRLPMRRELWPPDVPGWHWPQMLLFGQLVRHLDRPLYQPPSCIQ